MSDGMRLKQALPVPEHYMIGAQERMPGTVTDVMQALSKALEVLEQRCLVLHDRLDPILRAPGTEVGAMGEEAGYAGTSALGCLLQSLSLRAHKASQTMSDILTRLEL